MDDRRMLLLSIFYQLVRWLLGLTRSASKWLHGSDLGFVEVVSWLCGTG